MVTIRHIRSRHLRRKQGLKLLIDRRLFDDPEVVPESILSHKIHVSLTILDNAGHNRINFRHCLVRKEHGLNIGIEIPGQDHPVLFLVWTREFMLFNNALVIIFTGRGPDNAVLGLTIHGLRVDVVANLVILNEPPLVLEGPVIRHRLFV
jgi:hypothetical protein